MDDFYSREITLADMISSSFGCMNSRNLLIPQTRYSEVLLCHKTMSIVLELDICFELTADTQ